MLRRVLVVALTASAWLAFATSANALQLGFNDEDLLCGGGRHRDTAGALALTEMVRPANASEARLAAACVSCRAGKPLIR